MKKLILPSLAAATALTLTSCFQSETTVHLNKDGSGTLVEETSFGEQMKAMMAQMSAAGGDADKAKDPLAEMFSADKAKAKAASLGEGVTFDKVEKVSTNGKDGFRVTYKFKDVNKLKLNPGDFADNMKPPGAEDAKKDEPITFNYASGKLAIHMPKPPVKEKAEGEEKDKEEDADAEDPQQEAMMKQMFADMKVSVKVVADGGIDKSDATYTSGGTVTLMEMDFGKLMKDPGALKKLKSAKPESPEDFEKLFKGVDGVKMETKPEVSVTLK